LNFRKTATPENLPAWLLEYRRTRVRRFWAFLILLFVSVFTSAGGAADAQGASKSVAIRADENPLMAKFRSFSANVTGGIARDHDRKIYRSGKWMRLDFDDSYRVNNLETLEMWSVGARRCVKFDRPDAGSYPYSAYHDFKVERTTTEMKENIDGHPCKLEILTLTATDGRPIVAQMKLWEAQDLDGFPVRIDVEEGGHTFTSTYTNVSFEEPDPKLFEHPTRCTQGLQLGQKGIVKLDKPAK
jgi:hypothetical protein